jgi:hypothetical protein
VPSTPARDEHRPARVEIGEVVLAERLVAPPLDVRRQGDGLEAMEFDRVDILGFSIGSLVAQEMGLIRPAVGPAGEMQLEWNPERP